MHEEYPFFRQGKGRVLSVIMHAVVRVVREPGKMKQVARVVAVNEVNRQSQPEDRMQRGGRYEVAAVQYGLRTQRFCLPGGRSERLAVVVAVGDDADSQITSFPSAAGILARNIPAI